MVDLVGDHYAWITLIANNIEYNSAARMSKQIEIA